jgi:hypothetical protein
VARISAGLCTAFRRKSQEIVDEPGAVHVVSLRNWVHLAGLEIGVHVLSEGRATRLHDVYEEERWLGRLAHGSFSSERIAAHFHVLRR